MTKFYETDGEISNMTSQELDSIALEMKTYFTCVVYSGSTCMCRALRHTSNECGHKHKTEHAAQKCLAKLQNWSKDGETCSATWYNGQVVKRESEHDREVYDYVNDNGFVEEVSAYDTCKC